MNLDQYIPKKPSLLFCIIMDLIGYGTYALPVLGEFGDIIWAPLSAYVFYKTFGGAKGFFGGIFNFIEEAIPYTDFIPSFCMMWFMQKQGILPEKKKKSFWPFK